MAEQLHVNSMASICQTCGDVGYKELILCCSKCQISVEHRYCLAEIPPADDKGFIYICAQCLACSANQTSKQSPENGLRPSHRRKHRRQKIDQPAPLVQDPKEIPANRTLLAEVEAKELTRDTPPSSTLISEPLVEDAANTQDLENVLTKGETAYLKTSVSEALVKELLPQPDLNEKNNFPLITDKPTDIRDPKRWQIKGEAELQTCDVPVNLQTSVSKYLVKNVGAQACLVENNKSARAIDQSAPLVYDCKRKSSKGMAKVQTHGHPPHLKSSLSKPSVKHMLPKGEAKRQSCEVPRSELIVKDVLPQTGLNENSRCQRGIDQPTKGDVKLQTCDVPSGLQTSVSEVLVKDVPVQAHLNVNSCSPRKIDQPAALVQGLKKRQTNDSTTLASVVAEVQTCDVPPSLQTSSCDPFVKDVLAEVDLKEKNSSPRCSVEVSKELNGKRRRVIHDEQRTPDEMVGDVKGQNLSVVPIVPADPVICAAPLQIPSPCLSVEHTDKLCAQPILDPAWRGCFEICGEKYGRFVAHLSNKACLKVVETTKMLPAMLSIRVMPRLKAWPKSFNTSAPTDENIALYFFPGSESVVKAFDELMNRMVKRDLALKILLDNAELLIFSSNQLPLQYWRFNGKYYMWGVFKGRSDSLTRESGDGHTTVSSTSRESVRMSPLSHLSMSGSSSSSSPCYPLPLNNKPSSS